MKHFLLAAPPLEWLFFAFLLLKSLVWNIYCLIIHHTAFDRCHDSVWSHFKPLSSNSPSLVDINYFWASIFATDITLLISIPVDIRYLEDPLCTWSRTFSLVPERSCKTAGCSPFCSPAAHRGSPRSRRGYKVSVTNAHSSGKSLNHLFCYLGWKWASLSPKRCHSFSIWHLSWKSPKFDVQAKR